MPKTLKSGAKSSFKMIFLVRMYRMARTGMLDIEICKSLKVPKQTFLGWCRRIPEIKETLDLARQDKLENNTLTDWIYNKLSPDLKDLWKKIEKLSKAKDGVNQIELILSDYGKSTRQRLFLYALCVSNFSPSQALSKVNLTKKELDRWISEDPDFADLVMEVEWHKKNFFEETLVQLVREQNPGVVMFANRTKNSDRGYGNKLEVGVNHTGQILHGVLDLTELAPYLSENARVEVMSALRQIESLRDKKELTTTEFLSEQIANPELPENFEDKVELKVLQNGFKEIPDVDQPDTKSNLENTSSD